MYTTAVSNHPCKSLSYRMSSVSATEDFSSFWEFTSQGTSVSERFTDDVTSDDFGIRENRVKKLHHFAKNGNAKKLKKLLKIGVSPDDKSDLEQNCQGYVTSYCLAFAFIFSLLSLSCVS